MDLEGWAKFGLVAFGGAELRYALHRALRKLRNHGERLTALEEHRMPPKIIGEETSGARSIVQRFHGLGVLMLGALLMLGLTGCNEAQIARAQALSDAADAKLAAADAAQAEAQRALAGAKALAEQIGGEKAQQLVATAQAAVDAAAAAEGVAKVAASGAHDAVAAAKASQDAGASTISVLAAAAAALVPTAGGLVAAILKAAQAMQNFRQTVAGVDAAKAKLSPEAVATLHAELAKAQDQSTKAAVDKVQAASAAGSGT